MYNTLSKTYVEIAEKFIASCKPYKQYPSISEYDRESTIESWAKINELDAPSTTYLQFADNALGMNTYAFYKSLNNKIYILTAFMGNLTGYCNVDDTWQMLKPLENKETV